MYMSSQVNFSYLLTLSLQILDERSTPGVWPGVMGNHGSVGLTVHQELALLNGPVVVNLCSLNTNSICSDFITKCLLGLIIIVGL